MTAIVIGRITTYISYPQVTFSPKPREITAITNDNPAEVTTAVDHGYSSGIIVQLLVPESYGMEVNNRQAAITVTASNTFTIAINTLGLDPFVVPVSTQTEPSQCYPVTGTLINDYENS